MSIKEFNDELENLTSPLETFVDFPHILEHNTNIDRCGSSPACLTRPRGIIKSLMSMRSRDNQMANDSVSIRRRTAYALSVERMVPEHVVHAANDPSVLDQTFNSPTDDNNIVLSPVAPISIAGLTIDSSAPYMHLPAPTAESQYSRVLSMKDPITPDTMAVTRIKQGIRNQDSRSKLIAVIQSLSPIEVDCWLDSIENNNGPDTPSILRTTVPSLSMTPNIPDNDPRILSAHPPRVSVSNDSIRYSTYTPRDNDASGLCYNIPPSTALLNHEHRLELKKSKTKPKTARDDVSSESSSSNHTNSSCDPELATFDQHEALTVLTCNYY
jgi:hypothetical protein